MEAAPLKAIILLVYRDNWEMVL